MLQPLNGFFLHSPLRFQARFTLRNSISVHKDAVRGLKKLSSRNILCAV